MYIITPKNSYSPVILERQNNVQHRAIAMTGVDKVELPKTNPMEKPTQMLLSLVRNALNTNEPLDMQPFEKATYSDWKNMLALSQEASLSGVAMEAAHKLPKDAMPKDIALKMIKIQKESEVRHAAQEKILGELSETLSKKGIETIQMKGIGFSMNYPNPSHRFGGDIDIFTRLKGQETKEISNAYEIVEQFMKDKGLVVDDHNGSKKAKHSEFDIDGVRIENHRYFINKERMECARPLDEYLHKCIKPRTQILPNGTKILVPSKEFNSVFMAHHAYQHYIFSGLDLHHLTDWAVHLQKDGLQIPEAVKGTKFEEFTYALTNLSNKYLGTKVEVPENKQLEEKIFNKMLKAGEFQWVPEESNALQTIIFKIKRFMKNAKFAQEYTGVSPIKLLIKASIDKLKDPATILRRR